MYYRRNYASPSNILGTGIIAFIAGAALWALFGDKVKKSMNETSRFQDLKREVYDKASEVSDLTQEKYNSIVDEVTDRYAQVKGISKNELRDLVDDLRWHWKRIRTAWNDKHYSGPDKGMFDT